jgi:hypothetical protein
VAWARTRRPRGRSGRTRWRPQIDELCHGFTVAAWVGPSVRDAEEPRAVSAYAGWAGSPPPAEVDKRLQQVPQLAELPAERFAGAVARTMFSDAAPTELPR